MKVLVITADDVEHCQRCLGIFARLLLRISDLEVHFVCSENALARASKTIKIPPFLMQRIKIYHGIVDQTVGWQSQAEVYGDDRLISWESKLEPIMNMHNFHAVFSDNLVAPLKFRSDTILFGNFLWSDVLEDAFKNDTKVQEFAKYEKDILKKTRPRLLCSNEIVMPSILHKTQAIRCGLMTDPFSSQSKKSFKDDCYHIAVFNSQDVSDDEITADIVTAMHKRSTHRFYVEPACYDLIQDKDERIQKIEGNHQDFAKVDAVIGPPSMYYLNECLGNGIPLIMYYSPQHSEKTLFASRIRQAKLGYDLGSGLGVVSGIDAVKTMLHPRNYDELLASRSKINCNGYEEVVTWIERYIFG